MIGEGSLLRSRSWWFSRILEEGSPSRSSVKVAKSLNRGSARLLEGIDPRFNSF